MTSLVEDVGCALVFQSGHGKAWLNVRSLGVWESFTLTLNHKLCAVVHSVMEFEPFHAKSS